MKICCPLIPWNADTPTVKVAMKVFIGNMSASVTENEAKMEPRGFGMDAAAAAAAATEGGGMMRCGAHPSRPLTRHRICSIAERAN